MFVSFYSKYTKTISTADAWCQDDSSCAYGLVVLNSWSSECIHCHHLHGPSKLKFITKHSSEFVTFECFNACILITGRLLTTIKAE